MNRRAKKSTKLAPTPSDFFFFFGFHPKFRSLRVGSLLSHARVAKSEAIRWGVVCSSHGFATFKREVKLQTFLSRRRRRDNPGRLGQRLPFSRHN